MISKNSIIWPLCPVPPIALFKSGLDAPLVFDGHENYQKQTFRNRYNIATANGVKTLSIHVKRPSGQKIDTTALPLDYGKPWVRDHLRSIKTAYRSAPFFEHYFPIVEEILQTEYATIGSFFEAAFPKWIELLDLDLEWKFSKQYLNKVTAECDFRRDYKRPQDFPKRLVTNEYIQVFADRQPFAPNLSVIDLLMCLGPEAGAHLYL